jgi:hypothetical protein
MPKTRIFVEYHDNHPAIRHEVTMPDISEHDDYRQGVSFNAFTNFVGKLCAKTGRLTFHYKDEFSLKCEEESKARFLEQYGADKVGGWLIATELPGVSHSSIWEFYKYIGYDYKRKKLNAN